ncbi:hypothetical protein QUF96_03105 [Bacillus bombysepticus]|nr:hypothetical protein [Bacillus bombysepticus]
MRDVAVVKQTRDELRAEYNRCLAKRIEITRNRIYDELETYEKDKVSTLFHVMKTLQDQINAFEFVLNEDTELISPFRRRYKTTREEIFGDEVFER